MQTNVQLFSFKDQEVRVVFINDQPNWVLADVCKTLDLGDPSRVADRLDPKGTTFSSILSAGGPQEMLCINEPNLYRTIFRSNKPEAKVFQDWVFEEVLPAIRKTGSYSIYDKSPKEQLKDELSMLQFVHKVVHGVYIALSRRWIVANRQRARYAKVAFDYFRLDVIRADRAFTEVAKWHCGEDVFNDLNIKGDIAKMKAEIRNGEELEVQVQLPFDNEQ